jgi:CRISPR system Cascade subunit CasD
VESKFNRRGTEREPTKSGVIGLLAAALGRRRAESVDDLAFLKFGVRIDQPGQFLQDFHTARNENDAFVTRRHYLADAVFLVGLEGDDDFLRMLDEAVKSPVFPLYLGRRSCPPSGKISLGIRRKPLVDALMSESWMASEWYKKKSAKKTKTVSLTLVRDAEKPGTLYRRDMPVSYDQTHRKYTFRSVDDSADVVPVTLDITTEHDPFAELGV